MHVGNQLWWFDVSEQLHDEIEPICKWPWANCRPEATYHSQALLGEIPFSGAVTPITFLEGDWILRDVYIYINPQTNTVERQNATEILRTFFSLPFWEILLGGAVSRSGYSAVVGVWSQLMVSCSPRWCWPRGVGRKRIPGSAKSCLGSDENFCGRDLFYLYEVYTLYIYIYQMCERTRCDLSETMIWRS